MTKKTFPNLVTHLLENEPQVVSAMVERVNNAIEKRGAFEWQKKRNSSHVLFRKVAAQFSDSRTVAAFLVALNADPDLMFNRERKAGTRANLKGFAKVRQLIDYTTGKSDAFERVSLALFASTIIAANKGTTWIASPEQELILSSEKVNSLPTEVREAIKEYQHKHMTLEGDSRNESCRFRTTFANLGLYSMTREEFDNVDYTMGIRVDLKNPLIQYLSKRWKLERF